MITKNVLITGGTGSVGMNICQKFLREGHHVIMMARHPLAAAEEAELRSSGGTLTFCQCNVLDEYAIKDVMVRYHVTDIIHGAAVTPGAESDLKQARRTIEINCIGTISMLNAATECWLPGKFLMLGSISAYGRAALENKILTEGVTQADPRVIYEISKFAAERIFLRYKEASRLNGCVVRIGDVYGPWEHYSGVRPHMSLPYQAASLASKGEKARFSRDYSGEWIYAPELADAVYELLTAPKLSYDIYPLSSGNRWLISQWCSLLKGKFPDFDYELTDEEAKVNMRINQPTDNGAMSIQRLNEDTGFVSRFGLEQSFTDYMAWLDAHPGYLK